MVKLNSQIAPGHGSILSSLTERQSAPEEFNFIPSQLQEQHDSIQLQEAKNVLSEYKFKLITTVPGCYAHYVSGPSIWMLGERSSYSQFHSLC